MEGGFWAWFCKRTLRTRTSARTAGSRVGRARVPGGRRGRTGAASTGWDGADRGVGALRDGLKIRSSKKIHSGEDGRMAANREG